MSAVPQAGSSPPPDGLPDVFAEFCAAGLWPGLGAGLAARLAGAGITGPGLVNAARLELVEGIGSKRAQRLAAAFEAARPCYETAQLLVACRVPARFAGPAVARLGGTAQRQLREDPWRLLSLPQIRPDQADWFARQVLRDEAHPQDPRRGRALVDHLLARAARDGHTAVPARVIATTLARFRIADPAAAIAAAVDEGGVLPFDVPGTSPGPAEDGPDSQAAGQAQDRPDDQAGDGGGPDDQAADGIVLALARYAMAEEAVAEGLQRLAALAEPLAGTAAQPAGPAPMPPDSELDAAQRAAVRAVEQHGVSVLSGGPGTGKSRTVAAVVAMATARGLRVALAAPTGRAAKRLEELAAAPATTVHRLLGAQGRSQAATEPAGTTEPAAGGEAAWVFTRNEDWPLDADLVVVDEVSMLDVELAAALVEACADGTRMLLVGDPAQLPSIGPGRVLADIIDSGAVPVTELTRLYRQRDGGVIARLATAVRGGTLPPVDSADREVVVLGVRSSADAARRVIQLVTDSIPRALGIPAADIQVITPVHKGAAGTIELNRSLKQRLNPGPGSSGGSRGGFDPGDRVVSIANHADAGFTNGEVGTVTGPGDGGMLIAFPGGPVCVPDKLLGDLRHGWAITVHRAQGSEWPAVVAVFPAEATGMLSRPLVYTALTRAQHHLSVVHGAGPALARAVATIGERPRVTRLGTLLA
ncbi:MAG TPA: AAA family ATPase [Streptosporangiaceae bacterium]|nr:AAA family ATPase [Streptosporangiaceae bacterium]